MITRYGYGAFEAEGVIELQKLDEVCRFRTDRQAAAQCRQDALTGDPYAIRCIHTLAADYVRQGGLGRNGQPHDMDQFNLWGIPGI